MEVWLEARTGEFKKVVAAAPETKAERDELVEALREIVDYWDFVGSHNLGESERLKYDKNKALLAKIDGKEN